MFWPFSYFSPPKPAESEDETIETDEENVEEQPSGSDAEDVNSIEEEVAEYPATTRNTREEAEQALFDAYDQESFERFQSGALDVPMKTTQDEDRLDADDEYIRELLESRQYGAYDVPMTTTQDDVAEDTEDETADEVPITKRASDGGVKSVKDLLIDSYTNEGFEAYDGTGTRVDEDFINELIPEVEPKVGSRRSSRTLGRTPSPTTEMDTEPDFGILTKSVKDRNNFILANFTDELYDLQRRGHTPAEAWGFVSGSYDTFADEYPDEGKLIFFLRHEVTDGVKSKRSFSHRQDEYRAKMAQVVAKSGHEIAKELSKLFLQLMKRDHDPYDIYGQLTRLEETEYVVDRIMSQLQDGFEEEGPELALENFAPDVYHLLKLQLDQLNGKPLDLGYEIEGQKTTPTEHWLTSDFTPPLERSKLRKTLLAAEFSHDFQWLQKRGWSAVRAWAFIAYHFDQAFEGEASYLYDASLGEVARALKNSKHLKRESRRHGPNSAIASFAPQMYAEYLRRIKQRPDITDEVVEVYRWAMAQGYDPWYIYECEVVFEKTTARIQEQGSTLTTAQMMRRWFYDVEDNGVERSLFAWVPEYRAVLEGDRLNPADDPALDSPMPPTPRSPFGPVHAPFNAVMDTNRPTSPGLPRATGGKWKSTFKDYRVKKMPKYRYLNRLYEPRRLPNTPTKSHMPPSPRRKGPKPRKCEACGRPFRVVKAKKGGNKKSQAVEVEPEGPRRSGRTTRAPVRL